MRLEVQTTRLGPASSRRLARSLLEALEPLARVQVASLPPLYEAGVKYQMETRETFVDPVTCYRAGWGDCAHLSLWLVAQYRAQGIPARFLVDLMAERPDGARLYHVTVWLPGGHREDPSRRLGM